MMMVSSSAVGDVWIVTMVLFAWGNSFGFHILRLQGCMRCFLESSSVLLHSNGEVCSLTGGNYESGCDAS
jgi:hypothetical protein